MTPLEIVLTVVVIAILIDAIFGEVAIHRLRRRITAIEVSDSLVLTALTESNATELRARLHQLEIETREMLTSRSYNRYPEIDTRLQAVEVAIGELHTSLA